MPECLIDHVSKEEIAYSMYVVESMLPTTEWGIIKNGFKNALKNTMNLKKFNFHHLQPHKKHQGKSMKCWYSN